MDFKPLPGDPRLVADEAARMVVAAEEMIAAARILRRVAGSGEFVSEATEALEHNASEVATVMTNASTRYRGSGEALATYARHLEEAQRMADEARAAASATDVGHASSRVRDARLHLLNPLLDEHSRAEQQHELAMAQNAVTVERSRLAAATAKYETAVQMVDAAAKVAAAGIQDAVRASHLNDSFADDFRGFKDAYLVPALDAVVKVAAVVGTICTVVAIVLAFVPGLQPLAAVIFAAGKVMTIASVVAQGLQALVGERTWGEFATTALITVASLGKARLSQMKKTGSGANKLEGSGFAGEMGFKDSARYAATRARGGGLDVDGGVSALGDEAVDRAVDRYAGDDLAFVYGAITDPGGTATSVVAHGAGSLVDDVFPPEHAFTTDSLATHDVSGPVGDVSFDGDAVLANAFATIPSEPRVDLQMASSCSVAPGGAGGGGGGGW